MLVIAIYMSLPMIMNVYPQIYLFKQCLTFYMCVCVFVHISYHIV